MPHDGFAQCVFQVAGGVAFGLPGGHGVAEDLAAAFAGTVGGVQHAPHFHPAQHGQHLGRGDGAHGPLAQPGEHVHLQPPHDFAAVAVRPVGPPHFEPFAGHGFEAAGQGVAGGYQLFGLALLQGFGPGGFAVVAGVGACGDQAAGFVGLVTRQLEAGFWVGAQREGLAAAVDGVVQPPAVGTAFDEQQQVQALAIGQAFAWVTGFDGPYGGVRER